VIRKLIVGAVIAVLLAAAVLIAEEGYQYPRFRGTATPATHDIWVVMDSTDTFQVDTFNSDIVSLDACDDFLTYVLWLAGHTAADSANDSVIIKVNVRTRYSSEPWRTIITESFTTTLDTTEVETEIIQIDTTTIGSFVQFQTIVSDSFILGAGVDSSRYEFRYMVKTSQTAYEGDCD